MGGVRYFLRVVSPYEVLNKNDLNEVDDSETGDDGEVKVFLWTSIFRT